MRLAACNWTITPPIHRSRVPAMLRGTVYTLGLERGAGHYSVRVHELDTITHTSHGAGENGQ